MKTIKTFKKEYVVIEKDVFIDLLCDAEFGLDSACKTIETLLYVVTDLIKESEHNEKYVSTYETYTQNRLDQYRDIKKKIETTLLES